MALAMVVLMERWRCGYVVDWGSDLLECKLPMVSTRIDRFSLGVFPVPPYTRWVGNKSSTIAALEQLRAQLPFPSSTRKASAIPHTPRAKQKNPSQDIQNPVTPPNSQTSCKQTPRTRVHAHLQYTANAFADSLVASHPHTAIILPVIIRRSRLSIYQQTLEARLMC